MKKERTKRAFALDALRGLAIIGMVFAGVFPHEEPWPAWMFHAQVGPPDFTYNPRVPGITWVDLVFPFFLFSMGAAFPLALSGKPDTGFRKTAMTVLKRGALLVFFAIVLRHTNPGFLTAAPWINYVSGLLVFGCFFLVFMRFGTANKTKVFTLRMAGFGVILLLISLHSYFSPLDFNLYRQDIIILVLANMAVFGAFIWAFTRDNLLLRFGVLAFFAAIWLTKDYTGSYAALVYNFHPLAGWFYRFAFLKYLNIVIPGTVLGDMLIRNRNTVYGRDGSSRQMAYLGLICAALLAVNLYGLFTRALLFTFAADVVLVFAGGWLVSTFRTGREAFLKQLFSWGICWLLLGLAFEPLAGGIKKDPSSFSFWFLTSSLAFFAYIALEVLSHFQQASKWWKHLVMTGQNPMVAYVAGSFFILPVLYFLQIGEIFNYLREIHVYLGVVKPVAVTLCVVLLTAYTTRRKWFWRT